MAATVVRLRDSTAVEPRGAVGGTFADVRKGVDPPLDALVDACASTLGRPALAASTTPIQAECWGVLLGARPSDVVGVSPTGSGKTLAFLLPAFAQLLRSQPAAAAPPPVAGASAPAGTAVPAAAAAATIEGTAAADAAESSKLAAARAKERAGAAMRATAASAFTEAVKAGLSKEHAKAAARKQAQSAYKEAYKAALAASPPPSSSGSSSNNSCSCGSSVHSPTTRAPTLAPEVLILAPTRELCLQISAVCDAIVASLGAALGPACAAAVASGCVVGGVDFGRQRQALLLGARPRLLVATPGRLLSQCGATPASSLARAAAAEERGETPAAAGATGTADAWWLDCAPEMLPGRGSVGARRKLAARLAAEGKLAAPGVEPAAAGGAPSAGGGAAVDLAAVSLLILDEADRLLDLGFEADLHMALSLLATSAPPPAPPAPPPAPLARPRRTLLFSATFSRQIAELTAQLLQPSAVRITVGRPRATVAAVGTSARARETEAGDGGAADAEQLVSAASVTQRFEFFRGKTAKAAARRRLLTLVCELLGTAAECGGGGGGETDEDDEDVQSGARGEGDGEGEGEGEESGDTGGERRAEAIDICDGGGSGGGEEGGEEGGELPRVIVFALYKLEARQLADHLVSRGGLPAVALHGDMSQSARVGALSAFRSGAARVLLSLDAEYSPAYSDWHSRRHAFSCFNCSRDGETERIPSPCIRAVLCIHCTVLLAPVSSLTQVLVATDVAARGLDVRHVAAVVNTSLGLSLENYVHRVGRCGRAGAVGVATTFVVDGDEAQVPGLVALLERSRQKVPAEMRDLARKAEADTARAAAAGERTMADGDDDDEKERVQQQITNREKQLVRQRAKKSKETNQPKSR